MSFVSAPPPSGGLNYQALKGALLLIDVLEVSEHVPTVHTKPGEKSPAIRANVDVIDGPGAPDTYPDTLIFPKVLQSQLRTQVGAKVLGRLTQGNAKAGQSPPWLLDAASAEDTAKAEAYLREQATPLTTSAAPPF
jgi:hypothetical protein